MRTPGIFKIFDIDSLELLETRVSHHYPGILLKSGFYDTQTWGALDKAWLGYTIAKNEGQPEGMVYYAAVIQKLEGELGIKESQFPQLDSISALEEGTEQNEEQTRSVGSAEEEASLKRDKSSRKVT
ncbi:MAG: hypothetical protein M3Y53_06040 [Thermoproteota archaeon]|nr:hypothetical protein [Thermoproteota archaeon]